MNIISVYVIVNIISVYGIGSRPEGVLELHLYAQITLCPVLTLHRHLEHPRITSTGGEGKDGEKLQARDR